MFLGVYGCLYLLFRDSISSCSVDLVFALLFFPAKGGVVFDVDAGRQDVAVVADVGFAVGVG